jgi:hypothetical protein
MVRLFAILALLALAGCGTPLQQCERSATADLRTLEAERAERQRNLDRGYALELRLVPWFGPVMCHDPVTGQPVPCSLMADRWESVPVPVNRRLETRRIALLDQLITEERPRAAAALATCRAQFPQG